MQVLKNIAKAALAIGFTAAAMTSAHAAITPVTGSAALVPVALTGNQSFNGILGMDFTVRSVIRITEFGAYDSGQDGFTNRIQVGIFNVDTKQLVSPVITLTNDNTFADGTNRMIDIDSFDLGMGTYSIVAQGFSADDMNGNTGVSFRPASMINDGNGAITFTGGARYDFTSNFGLPTTLDGGPANRYDAGTFAFREVPEPETLALFGLGLLALSLGRRRSK